MNFRPPLFAFFVLVTLFAIATIVALVAWLDTFQADAAHTAAESAVTGALLHGVEVVAEPLRALQVLAKEAALLANSSQDFADDGRTSAASMIPLHRHYLALLHGSPTAYYIYQSFVHHGHWTYSGCGRGECIFAANGTQYGTAADFPNVNVDWVEEWGSSDGWTFDDSGYVQNIKAMTYSDTEGSFDPFEIFELDGLLGGIQIPLKFAPNGSCVLAQGADVHATDMRARLLKLSLEKTVVALIDTDRKLLLATTADIGLPVDAQWLNDTAGNPRLMGIGEIPNAVMRDAVARAAPTMAALTKPAVIDTGGKDIVGIAPVIVLNSRLTIVTVTERDFFYSTLADTRRSAAIIGSVGAALCVLVSAVVCLLVSVALHRLRAAMVPAAKLRLSPEELEAAGRSVVRDVAALQDAFAEMNARLHEAGAYIPHALRVAWSEEDGSAPDDTENDEAGPSSLEFGSVGDAFSSHLSSKGSPVVFDVRGRRSTGSRSFGARSTTTVMTKHRVGSAGESQLFAAASTRATVLVVNTRGFSQLTAHSSPADIRETADTIAKIVFDAAVKHRGVLDSFQGDRFLVTFNASSRTAAHTTKAALCARTVRDAVAAHDHLSGATVSCGVATGPLVVGDIGCKEMKRFGLIGHAFTRALALERLCCSYGPTEYCAVAAAAFADLAAHFSITRVDYVKLPGITRPCSIGVLGATHESGGDEWLYVVGQGPAASKGPTAVIAHLMRGATTEARAEWEKYTADDSNSVSTAACGAVLAARKTAQALLRQAEGGRCVADDGRDLGEYYKLSCLNSTGCVFSPRGE